MIDVAIDEALARRRPHLLLCTNGTRAARIFQRHERWDEASRYLLLPDQPDQQRLHEAIYSLKRTHDVASLVPLIGKLLGKYNVSSMMTGCTDLHLLTRYLSRQPSDCHIEITDPLEIIARNLKNFLEDH